mmetsp:Transcript_107516/g.309513  ORF Transcript_107516/g.309513 Transcript_107516/m.309513 type:complete len:226 (-) Transcript_107516:162-839(-)
MDLHRPLVSGGRDGREGHRPGRHYPLVPHPRFERAERHPGPRQVLRWHLQVPAHLHGQRPPRRELQGLPVPRLAGVLRFWKDHHGREQVFRQGGLVPQGLRRLPDCDVRLHDGRRGRRLRGPQRQDQRHVLRRHRREGSLRGEHQHRPCRSRPLSEELRELPPEADLLEQRLRRELLRPAAGAHAWRQQRLLGPGAAGNEAGGAGGASGAGGAGRPSSSGWPMQR